MLRLHKTAALLLMLALCAIATTTAATPTSGGVSLRDACELKCAEQKDKTSADCEDELGMGLDTSFVTTCQTESAREAEYCVAGCAALGA